MEPMGKGLTRYARARRRTGGRGCAAKERIEEQTVEGAEVKDCVLVDHIQLHRFGPSFF